jgi:hypothetical protein
MGLNESGPRATYLSVADGSLVMRLKSADDDPKAEARTLKNGNVVYERKFRSFDGYITNLQIADSKFNGEYIEKSQWKLTVVDDNKTYILTMPYSSAYAKRLINSLAAIDDLSQPIRILPWKMENPEKADKYWLGVTLYTAPFQGDTCKVKPKYDKEQIPPMVETKFKGKVAWDDEEQMQFWEKVVTKEVMPKLKQARTDLQAASLSHHDDDEGDAYEPVGADEPQGDHELPF